MNSNQAQEIQNQLAKDWELEQQEQLSEEELLRLLCRRVLQYLEREPENFFPADVSTGYLEKRLQQALLEADPPLAIARLIYTRQLEKVQSRQQFQKPAWSG